MNKNIIRPFFEHRFLLFVAFFCTTASAKQIRGVADYIYPVALIATAAQYFYSSPKRAEIPVTTKEKPNIYAISDGTLHITGALPHPVGKTACEPVTDIDGEKKWQCFGSENHYAAVELPFSQPSEPDKAIGIGIFNNPEQQVLIYYGAVLPEAFSGQHLYDAGKAVSGRAERQRRIEREASERKQMLRIRKSYGDQPDARYLHLQTIDGISVQERKELESRLRLGQDNGESDSRDDLKMHADQLMQSFNGDSFIPVDTSFCNSETKAACQEILSRITTLVNPSGNSNSANGKSSGDQASAAASGASSQDGEHTEPPSAEDVMRELIQYHSEPVSFLRRNRDFLANYLRRSLEEVRGVGRCDDGTPCNVSFKEHLDGSFSISIDVFTCCRFKDLHQNKKCTHTYFKNFTYNSANIDEQENAEMCLRTLQQDHWVDRAMLVTQIDYPAAWNYHTRLYINAYNYYSDTITLEESDGDNTRRRTIQLSNVLRNWEINWDQFKGELNRNGMSYNTLMDAKIASTSTWEFTKSLLGFTSRSTNSRRSGGQTSSADITASGHGREPQSVDDLLRALPHTEPNNFLEGNQYVLANYLSRSFEAVRGVGRCDNASHCRVFHERSMDFGCMLNFVISNCHRFRDQPLNNKKSEHTRLTSFVYCSKNIDKLENAETCLATLLHDHSTDRVFLAAMIAYPAAWNDNTELYISSWDVYEDIIILEYGAGTEVASTTMTLSHVFDFTNWSINWGQLKEELERRGLSFEKLMDATQVRKVEYDSHGF